MSENNELKLAPSFDHAAGLASKVSEKEAIERLNTKDKNRKIVTFCQKATTPFYKDNKKLKTFEVVQELLHLGEKSVLFWINKILQIDTREYDRILHKIPDSFVIYEAQKAFIKKMLETNTQTLREIKEKQ